MTNLRLQAFHLQMRLSSAEALAGVAAAPVDCEVALVAPVEGAGVLLLEELLPELCSSGLADIVRVWCVLPVGDGCGRLDGKKGGTWMETDKSGPERSGGGRGKGLILDELFSLQEWNEERSEQSSQRLLEISSERTQTGSGRCWAIALSSYSRVSSEHDRRRGLAGLGEGLGSRGSRDCARQ